MDTFCQEEIEKENTEADHVAINALTSYFEQPVEINAV